MIGGSSDLGAATLGRMLAKCLVRSGYRVVATSDRSVDQRESFAIRVSPSSIDAPQESIDLLVALDNDAVSSHCSALSSQSVIVADKNVRSTANVEVVRIPLCNADHNTPTYIYYLGALCRLLQVKREVVESTIIDFFGKKFERREEFVRSILAAYDQTSDDPRLSNCLPRVFDQPRRMLVNGYESTALGAMSAGMKFCSFSELTPLSDVLNRHAKKMGVVLKQTEDELQAMSMAVGASFAGVTSMTVIWSRDLCFLGKSVDLAGISETPIVIAVCQSDDRSDSRIDLDALARFENERYPKAVFAPGTINEAFHLTRRAFELAERYQIPVFILIDRGIAEIYHSATMFDPEVLSPVRIAHRAAFGKYRRYALTPDGISPRLLPGTPINKVIASGKNHREDGLPVDHPAVQKVMAEKMAKKAEGLRADVMPPSYDGPEASSLLLVCSGSMKGAVSEAVSELRESGRNASMMHFSQIWPLMPIYFLPRLESAAKVVCIEGNHGNQMASLIRQETGFDIKDIIRFDEHSITAKKILDRL